MTIFCSTTSASLQPRLRPPKQRSVQDRNLLLYAGLESQPKRNLDQHNHTFKAQKSFSCTALQNIHGSYLFLPNFLSGHSRLPSPLPLQLLSITTFLSFLFLSEQTSVLWAAARPQVVLHFASKTSNFSLLIFVRPPLSFSHCFLPQRLSSRQL